ncbi:glycosyltransferase family 9 protein [Uliginosibacterium sp. sgz301328]|uniref:glycosyltransferase family 9 protein n=1 Tax=Uliginosibacterium sp. sgz301328 TaxID=3243764 RepID=UPI00359DB5A0
MSWFDAQHILCVRFDVRGDLSMCQPALQLLKHDLPSRRITLLTSPPCATPAQRIEEVDHVILYDAPWLSIASENEAIADRRMIARIDAGDFDGAVIFTRRGESALPAALMCMLADIPLRLGRGADQPGRLLTHWVRDTSIDEDASEAQRQLIMVRTIVAGEIARSGPRAPERRASPAQAGL